MLNEFKMEFFPSHSAQSLIRSWRFRIDQIEVLDSELAFRYTDNIDGVLPCFLKNIDLELCELSVNFRLFSKLLKIPEQIHQKLLEI